MKKALSRHVGLHRFLLVAYPTVAIVMFASYAPMSKRIVEDINPIFVTLYVQILSISVFFLFLGILPELKKAIKESHHKRISFITFSLLTGTAAPLMSLFGLKYTTALNAALLVNTYSLFILLFSIFVFKEKIPVGKIVGMCILLSGILYIVFEGKIQTFKFNMGDLLIISAQLLYAFSDVIYKKYLNDMDTDVAIFGKNVLSAIIMLALAFMFFSDIDFSVTRDNIPFLLSLAIFPALLAQFFWYRSVQLCEGATLSAMSMSQPIFGILFAFLLLGEQLYNHHIFGGALILVGLAISLIELRPKHFYHQVHVHRNVHK